MMNDERSTILVYRNRVRIDYIQPGSPNQNAYIERFNRSYREEVLDPHIFSTLWCET